MSESLRPGVAQGAYPERRVERESWLERTVHALHGGVARRREASRARLEGFVQSAAAHRGELRTASPAEFETRIQEARRRLGVEGLTEAALPRCFALIREAARRSLGLEPYDVQLMGGWVMARGMLAEMQTGEGKTLTATLPACAAALAGIPVHVITANDYLVERDAEEMRPVYEMLGLSVGAVTERKKEAGVRRAAYACDVTYATAKTVAFDYLRDGLARGSRRAAPGAASGRAAGAGPLLLRGLCFAVVDEADSSLIDEARTPLILSGTGGSVEQRRTYRRALRLARALEEGRDFQVDRAKRTIELTSHGQARLEELAKPLPGFWTGPRRREEWVVRGLSALHLFLCDRDYLVRDGQVQIIDQPTGRAAPDRSWEGGLHQLIELKEGCKLTPERETLARISYQQFFRRYLRLSGMTGTAREVARELWSVYALNTIVIPTRRPLQRRNLGTRVFATQDAKWQAVVERVRELHAAGRPVLIGTCSVEASEHLSRRLEEADLPHQVLNARHDAAEAAIVAQAGQPGRITVATNMAGRGTDIRLAAGIAERGGLHVIATERGEARRIDRQLFGRCGRQGDPGSHEAILSLEDEPQRLYYPAGFLRFLQERAGGKPLSRRLGERLTSLPQRSEERRTARVRRSLVDLEEFLADLLAFAGPGE